MGKVTGNWLTGVHSGRACRHESIYTKVNKKTGKCYSAKLCNPNPTSTDGQVAHRNVFGQQSAAINIWINEQMEAKSAAYQALKAQFDRQTKYSTLRGYMMAKNMAEVVDEDTVRITVAGETFDIAANGTVAANANTNANSGSQSSNANSGSSANSGSTSGTDTSTSGGNTDTSAGGSTSGGSSSSASTTDGDNFN